MEKVSIIGAGSWGCALALLLSDNGHQVTVWSKLQSEVDELNKKHEHKTLPGVYFPDSMTFTADIEMATKASDILILAIPSIYTRDIARNISDYVRKDQIIVNVSKGIEESTLKILTDQIEEEIPDVNVCVLSGPSHAEEVSKRIPTACVVGARDKQVAERIRDMFMNKVFRVYISSDMLGIELGGALKNVIALAAGITDGLGYGDNTKAALITRGIAEMSRLGVAMGGREETFNGLTGIGDLIVTCTSMHSRNRRAGILIGKGKSMKEAMDEVQMVVEGVYSAKAALLLSQKYNVHMPIVTEVNHILFDSKDARSAVDDLMTRDKTLEHNDIKW